MTQDGTQAKRGPGPEHRLLDVFIGKWINEGYTVATAEVPAAKILTSDIYERTAGGTSSCTRRTGWPAASTGAGWR